MSKHPCFDWASDSLKEICYGRTYTDQEINDVAEELHRITSGERRKPHPDHQRPVTVYHTTTTDEAAQSIIKDGFKESSCRVGFTAAERPPVVWVSDFPMVGVASMHYYRPGDDEWINNWIAIDLPCSALVNREYLEGSWSSRQWMFPSDVINLFSRRIMPLNEVLSHQREDFAERWIREIKELGGPAEYWEYRILSAEAVTS